jgi:hypothetical protein
MRRAAAIALALVPLAYGAVALFAGLLSAGMQCDEICRTDATDWRYTSGAWQWYAIGALGAITFAAGVLFLASVITRRPVRAIACLGVGVAAVVTAMTGLLVNPGSDQELHLGLFWLVSAGVLAIGLLAAALAATSTGPVRAAPDFRLVTRRVVAGLAFLAAAYFLLGGLSTLFGGTVGVPTAPLLGKAALFAFIGWGFWRGGFRPRGRMG